VGTPSEAVGTPSEAVGTPSETVATPGEKGGLDVVDAPAKTPLTRHPNFFSGGGGLVSTASDYLRFAQMLLNKGELDGVRLLGRKTVEFMTRNHLSETALQNRSDPLGPGLGFGLGGHVVMDAAQYGGLCSDGTFSWGGAARTDFWVDFREDLIGIFMIQVIGGDTPWLAGDFKVLTYQAIVD
jgi:CubicO group peptidase (beta-lactamase class C family)